MAYYISDSYGGFQSAAQRGYDQQAENWWRAVQANRSAAEARKQDYWRYIQAQQDAQRLAASQDLARRQFEESKRQHEGSLKYSYDALKAQTERELARDRDYERRLAEQNQRGVFPDVYKEVVADRVTNIPALEAMTQAFGGVKPEERTGLVAALAARQKKRREEFETGAKETAQQLTENAEIQLEEAKRLLTEAEAKKPSNFLFWGTSQEEIDKEKEAKKAALNKQFEALSSGVMKNPAYRKLVRPNLAERTFEPAVPEPTDFDAIAPAEVTPAGATGKVVAPKQPPKEEEKAPPSKLEVLQEAQLRIVKEQLAAGKITPAVARRRRAEILARREEDFLTPADQWRYVM